MRNTEQEAKSLLMEQLDKSLLDHAVALGQKEGGPSIVDAYGLQYMAELHYYLKVEHEFTAAEVEALLSFVDPLAVAQNCWEENGHEHSFPICKLLDEINAYERFPLKDPSAYAQGQEQLVEAVKAALDQEMLQYQTSLMSMSKAELIGKSGEIAAMKDALDFMKHDYIFEKGDAEALLRMEKPLRFVADQWPSEIATLFDMSEQIAEAIGTAEAYQHEAETAPQESTRSEKPSVRGQLRAAMREARQHPAQEDKSQVGDDR